MTPKPLSVTGEGHFMMRQDISGLAEMERAETWKRLWHYTPLNTRRESYAVLRKTETVVELLDPATGVTFQRHGLSCLTS